MLCYTHIWSHMYIILCIRLIKVLLGYLWPRYATFAFGPQLSSTPRRDHWMGLREHLNGKPWFLPWKRGFSLDWFKGKSTGNPHICWEKPGFPVQISLKPIHWYLRKKVWRGVPRVPKPPSIDPLGPARFYAIILQGGYNCPARVGRLRSWTWLVQTFDDLRILPYITLW